MTTRTSPRSCSALPLLLAFGLAGCGGGDDYAHYFNPKPYRDSSCNGNDERLTTSREVRLFTFGNTDAPPFSRALQRYYRRHGLAFFSKHPVMQVEQNYILDSDSFALDAGLAREFPGVDLEDEQKLMADPALYARVVTYTMNFVFRPLIEFARAHGTAGPQVTNLVIVPEILRPDGDALFGPDAVVLGLAISPALIEVFARQDLVEGAAWKSLDLPKDFSPMFFLDGRILGQLQSAAPDLVDLVAAHEFGHTNALVHREVEHNLMLPAIQLGISNCNDELEDDQIGTVRATLGLSPAGAPLRVRTPAPEQSAPALDEILPPSELAALLRGDRKALAKLVRRFGH